MAVCLFYKAFGEERHQNHPGVGEAITAAITMVRNQEGIPSHITEFDGRKTLVHKRALQQQIDFAIQDMPIDIEHDPAMDAIHAENEAAYQRTLQAQAELEATPGYGSF